MLRRSAPCDNIDLVDGDPDSELVKDDKPSFSGPDRGPGALAADKPNDEREFDLDIEEGDDNPDDEENGDREEGDNNGLLTAFDQTHSTDHRFYNKHCDGHLVLTLIDVLHIRSASLD